MTNLTIFEKAVYAFTPHGFSSAYDATPASEFFFTPFAVISSVANQLGQLPEVAANTYNATSTYANAALEAATPYATDAYNTASTYAANAYNATSTYAANAYNATSTYANAALEAATPYATDAYNTASTYANAAVEAASHAPTIAYDLAAQAQQLSGDAYNAAGTYAADVYNTAGAYVNHAYNTFSPIANTAIETAVEAAPTIAKTAAAVAIAAAGSTTVAYGAMKLAQRAAAQKAAAQKAAAEKETFEEILSWTQAGQEEASEIAAKANFEEILSWTQAAQEEAEKKAAADKIAAEKEAAAQKRLINRVRAIPANLEASRQVFAARAQATAEKSASLISRVFGFIIKAPLSGLNLIMNSIKAAARFIANTATYTLGLFKSSKSESAAPSVVELSAPAVHNVEAMLNAQSQLKAETTSDNPKACCASATAIEETVASRRPSR